MNPDFNISWKIKIVKFAISVMAVSVQQTLDGWTLDVQEDRIIRCGAVIPYIAGSCLGSASVLVVSSILHTVRTPSSTCSNICGRGYAS